MLICYLYFKVRFFQICRVKDSNSYGIRFEQQVINCDRFNQNILKGGSRTPDSEALKPLADLIWA